MPRGLFRLWSLLLFLLALAVVTWAQEPGHSNETSCRNPKTVSVPSRPTVSNGTDTTQCGVLELEYGLERLWPGEGANRDDLAGGLRLGLLPNLDFHWQSAAFLHITGPGGDRTGFGDTSLGLKYRVLSQSRVRPSLGLYYQVKVPSANEAFGLGTGQVDHAFSLLVSKDIRPIHFDFNVTPIMAGRVVESGSDHSVGFALSGSTALLKRLGLVVEGYGYTYLNQDNPAFASTMVAFTYQVNPRFVLDTGLDVGITSDAPHKRVSVGITYAITNLYSLIHPDKAAALSAAPASPHPQAPDLPLE